jgi:hypothetical protein
MKFTARVYWARIALVAVAVLGARAAEAQSTVGIPGTRW